MSLTKRNLAAFGAAAFAAAAFTVPALALAPAANAATPQAAPTATATYDSQQYPWGPYYAKHFKAKAEGVVHVDTDHDDLSNKVTVHGKLHDLDFRTYAEGGKCAFVQFKIHHIHAPHWKWKNGPAYKWCGADKDPKSFVFWKHDVDAVKVRVAQIDKWGHHVTKKGHWHFAYTAK